MTATENLQPHRVSSYLAGAHACNIITSKQNFKLLLLLLGSLWNFTSSVDCAGLFKHHVNVINP